MRTTTQARDRTVVVSRPPNTGTVMVACGASLLLLLLLGSGVGWTQALLFGIGLGAGLVLYHAAFGFTTAWRTLILDRRGEGLRAQMVMLTLTCAAFIPLVAMGEVFGHPVRGSIAPIGLPVLVGAFLFGVGMQLAGGCASGTLFSVGGGSVRMLVVLAAFIAGSVLGVWHAPLWEATPTLGTFSLIASFGPAGALVASVFLFGAVALLSYNAERRAHGARVKFLTWPETDSWLRGPWPMVAGAIGLAVVNIATLIFAGRPWGVTSAFALWGSKLLATLGVDVASWPYWQPAARAADLRGSLAADVTTVMDLGIMLGALLAAGLAGRFAPVWRVPARALLAAVLGGVMLGYGARIAYGCNIGAFFSGTASTSLHGWLWFFAAFTGSAFGTRLRPFFGLKG